MSQKNLFPTLQLYRNGSEPVDVFCFGLSGGGSQALISERVPMQEHHLRTGGGVSRVSRADERSQPKTILRMRLVSYCAAHGVVWDNRAACPKCVPNAKVEE